jgi:hypothetical protein
MAEKKITVVIDGQEFVSKAADSAGGAMDGFAGKIPAWGKTIALATAAFAALSKAVEAVGDFVMGSIDAYDRFASSQNKMAAQSKLTGVSLADLKETAKIAREEFNLGSVVANDAATTVAKYASRAGDATKKNELLAAALDLGAASGYTAAESMDALEQGLRGQDEGFDKLLGKNPSALWKEYADANGLAVGKMTDTQKRMAELTAIVDAGNVVQGSYNERIASGAGQTEAMSNQMDNAKVAFGAAIQPLRIFIVQGLVKLIELATPVVVGIARVANAVGVVFVGSFQLARSAVGSLIEGVGKLTGSKSLEEWGAKQAAAFPEFVKQLDAMEKKLDSSGEAATQHGTQHALATVKIVASAKENTKAVSESADAINAKLDAKLGTPMKQLIGLTEGAIRDLGTAAREQLPPETAAKFNEHMAALAANAEHVRERLTATGPATQAVSRTTKDIASEIGMVARGAIDAAGAFGVIDESAVRSLNSAVNIAAALGNMAKNGFSFAGVTGVIGGVASIVSGMMAADAERRRLLRENNTQLQRLREEGISLSTKVSGDKVSKIFQALSGADLSSQYFVSKEKSVLEQLAKFGVTVRDLEAVANEYGIQNVAKDGQIQNFVALRQLIEALKISGGVRVGQSFSDQLQFFRDSQRANGNEGVGGIQGLIDFLRNVGGVSALNGIDVMSDPAGAANALRAIFTSLNNAEGIDPARIGRLTGSQFSSILLEIIDSLRGAGGGSTGSSTGGDGTVTTGPTITSGGVTVPTKTLSDVLDGVVAQTTALGAYHVKHLDIATAHLNEAKMQTTILAEIATNTRGLADGGITSIADKGLEAERLSLAAERGIGASF